MKKYCAMTLVLSYLVIASLFWAFPSCSAQAADTAISTAKDQIGLQVTVYNNNLGLIKDQRALTVFPGRQDLRFMDVASKIIPTSVQVVSLTDPKSLLIIEQTYEYDLLSPQKLLDKFVGKEVQLFERNPYTDREEVVTATLMSNNNGPIYKIGETIIFGHPGRVIFPRLPEELISRPTLVWAVDNKLNTQRIEASYLTEGILWRADYVATLSRDEDRIDLTGWVTIANQSGAVYRDARLKLIAGDVNRVREEVDYRAKAPRAMAESAAAPKFTEEAFFEYHMYSLDKPTTLKDNQTKQINFISAGDVKIKKQLLLLGDRYGYYNSVGDTEVKQKIDVVIEFENGAQNNLGIPLPKGIVRVYKEDSDRMLQFVGEDSIDHSPKDAKLRLKTGSAFDVTAVRKQTRWRKLAPQTYEVAYEIKLKNHKKEVVAVRVLEPIPGEWQITESSYPHKQANAFTAEFLIPVMADGEATLSYTVKTSF